MRILSSESRADVWLAKAQYNQLKDDQGHLSKESTVSSQVEMEIAKDVPRTRTELLEACGGEEPLFAVLRRLAAVEPRIGYCQGLNSVGAVALSALTDPNDSFLFLIWLVRRNLGYYTGTMAMMLVHARIAEDLLSFYLPTLSDHMKRAGVHARDLFAPWLICQFIDSPVAFPDCLKVLDLVVAREKEAPFLVCLGMIAQLSEKLLACRDQEEILSTVLHVLPSSIDVDDLCRWVILEYQRLEDDLGHHIASLEQMHRAHVLQESLRLPSGTSKKIHRLTGVDEKYLQVLWTCFLKSDPWKILIDGVISSDANFCEAFTSVVFRAEKKKWRGHGVLSGVMSRMIQIASSSGQDYISFVDFVNLIQMFTEDSHRKERLKFCYRFCDFDGDGFIDSRDLSRFATMFVRMYDGDGIPVGLEPQFFCEIAFEKFGQKQDGRTVLDFQSFCNVAVLHPYILKFFMLDEILSGGLHNIDFGK